VSAWAFRLSLLTEPTTGTSRGVRVFEFLVVEDNAAALDGATAAAVPVATLAILGAEDDDVNATLCFELEKAAAMARLAKYAGDGEDNLGKA
jgi:hypothetical protein